MPELAEPLRWWDENPYVLVLSTKDWRIAIDLGEPQWLKKWEIQLTSADTWVLTPKPAPGKMPTLGLLFGSLWMKVGLDEEPYYVARHIHDGLTGREVIAYGIGKTRGGHTDRLWILPNGIVCGSDDLESLAITLIRDGTI